MSKERITNKQIALCLADFDFKSATKIYELLDWKWAGLDHTPETQDLAETAYKLCKSLQVKENLEMTGTGGLEVHREDGCLTLKLVALSSVG